MSLTENFLVNTKNFESILKELRSVDKLPGQLNNAFLERLGYSNPSDLLVLHLFKDLEMLEQDGTPTPLFEKFRNDATTNEAMAEGITNAYKELFKNNPNIYKLQEDDLKEEFKKYFGSSKSDLIIKYMANTFLTLIDYAGLKTMDEVAGRKSEEFNDSSTSVNKVTEHQNNGTSKPPTSNSDAEEEIAVAEPDDTIKNEEKGKAAIEEIFPKKKEKDQEEKETEQKAEPESSSPSAIEPKTESRSEPDSDSKKKTDPEPKSDLESELEAKLESKSESPSKSPSDSKPDMDMGTKSDSKSKLKSEEPPVESRDQDAGDDEVKKRIEERKKEIEENKKAHEQANNQNPAEPAAKGQEEPEEMHTTSNSKSAEDTESNDPFGFEDDDEEIDESEIEELEMEKTSLKKEEKKENENVEKAFVKKAELLYKLEKYEEALPAYKKIIERYRESDKFQEQVSRAIIRRAGILGKLERYDEALPAYDELFERFENSENTEFYNYASEALIKKVEIMEMLELKEQLLPLYAKVVKRLGDSEEPRFANHVDKAYVKVAKMKLDSGEPEKALKAINGVINRFVKSDRENEFLEQAMYQKAELLEQLGRDEEALEAYESFLSKFGSDS